MCSSPEIRTTGANMDPDTRYRKALVSHGIRSDRCCVSKPQHPPGKPIKTRSVQFSLAQFSSRARDTSFRPELRSAPASKDCAVAEVFANATFRHVLIRAQCRAVAAGKRYPVPRPLSTSFWVGSASRVAQVRLHPCPGFQNALDGAFKPYETKHCSNSEHLSKKSTEKRLLAAGLWPAA